MELTEAVLNHNTQRVHKLLEQGLHHTLFKSIHELFGQGVDPDIQDNRGKTTLMWASSMGDINIVRLLLEYGANPNIQDNRGETSLMMASSNNYTDIVELLLENNADPNIINSDGETSLLIASKYGRINIVRLLLENGVDLDIQDNRGRTSLIMASKEGDTLSYQIVKLLLENGADPNIRDINGQTPYDIALDMDYVNYDIVRLIKNHMILQRNLQRAQQNLAFMKYFLDNDDLDIDTASKIFSNKRSYNPGVSRRIKDEHHRNTMLKNENDRIADFVDYLNTLDQYGMGKRSKRRYARNRY